MKIETSDHAVLRWLELVEGVNVVAIRRRIAGLSATAVKHGANGVTAQGINFKLAYPNNTHAVVTTAHCNKTKPELVEPRVEPWLERVENDE